MPRHLDKAAVLVAALVLAVGWSLLPGHGSSQDQQILFNRVTVSGDQASLLLELSGGDEISLSFADGEIVLDGTVVGEYAPGDPLEASWRTLLAGAISLDPGDMAEHLRSWTVPAGREGWSVQAAARIRERLSGVLQAADASPNVQILSDLPAGSLESLLRSDRLRELATIADDLAGATVRIHIGESVQIGADEVVEGTLIVVDGQLELDGIVEGDVVLLGGSAFVGPDATVNGALRNSEADLDGSLDGIVGGVSGIEANGAGAISRADVDALISEAVREAREEAESALVVQRAPSRSVFRRFGQGLEGLFALLVLFGTAFVIGLAVLYFFPRNLELVSRSARLEAGKSLLVGMAGFILALPLWIVGMILLGVSIVGIPLLLVWVPALPVAAGAAVALGYFAVARNVGRWISGRDFSSLDGFDTARPAVQIGVGLAALLGVFALSQVFVMIGLSDLEELLLFLGVAITGVAMCLGFGSVILSQAGRSPWTRKATAEEAPGATDDAAV